MSRWGGRRVTELRKALAEQLPMPCARCGKPVMPGQRWDIGHIVGRDVDPELAWDPDNWRVEHAACNRAAGAAYVNRKRARQRPRRQRISPTSRDW